MKLNTNSNSYIIIYSAILVVIVAFLLAFVYQALKPMQDANVALDIKKQILYSLKVVKEEKKAGDKLYYECEIDGQKKYVFPLKGMGLWGGISAFVSVNDDLNTIYGAYFNHESETAGLGAEIKDSQAWQEKFQGKKIYSDDGQLAIGVVKNVENPASEVDCVTGATLTSNGVSDMLRTDLNEYISKMKED